MQLYHSVVVIESAIFDLKGLPSCARPLGRFDGKSMFEIYQILNKRIRHGHSEYLVIFKVIRIHMLSGNLLRLVKWKCVCICLFQ